MSKTFYFQKCFVSKQYFHQKFHEKYLSLNEIYLEKVEKMSGPKIYWINNLTQNFVPKQLLNTFQIPSLMVQKPLKHPWVYDLPPPMLGLRNLISVINRRGPSISFIRLIQQFSHWNKKVKIDIITDSLENQISAINQSGQINPNRKKVFIILF